MPGAGFESFNEFLLARVTPSGVSFSGVSLSGVSPSGVSPSRVFFTGVSLSGVSPSGAFFHESLYRKFAFQDFVFLKCF